MQTPSIEGYADYTITFKLENMPSGNHQIKLIANSKNDFYEPNKSNNSCSNYFLWEESGTPDLVVSNLKLIDGDKKYNGDDLFFSSECELPAVIEVENIGTVASPIGAELRYYVNSFTNYAVIDTLKSLPPKGKVRFHVTLSVQTPGNLEIRLTVNENNAISNDPKGNNITITKLSAFEEHTRRDYPGLFYSKDNSDLQFKIESSANKVASNSLITQGLTSWNYYNIGRKVVINPNATNVIKYSQVKSNVLSEDLNIGLLAIVTLAETEYKVPTHGSNPNRQYDLDMPTENITIKLYQPLINENDTKKMATITHEVGHALGLPDFNLDNHQKCTSIALMNQFASGMGSTSIQPHDIASARARYIMREYLKHE